MTRASGSGAADLWAPARAEAVRRAEPLAVRMRPRTLDEVVGQGQILGPGKLLRRMIDADALMSLILHGPPGTGKTTLAEVIAQHSKRRFVRENAAGVGVARIREIIADAERHLGETQRRTILFLDEIHRFTKNQQDVLLADVERGLITLIGATTENPLFSVNAALISRSTLFRVEPLSEDEIVTVLRRAIADVDRGYGGRAIEASERALRVWAVKSEGDARRALTALEVAVESSRGGDAESSRSEGSDGGERSEASRGDASASGGAISDSGRRIGERGTIVIDERLAEDSIQAKVAAYGDDGHYDAASALIKSVRGSDADAGLYWCARMLEAGEDPRFIVRRLAILASEDIGNADPNAIVMAHAAWALVERIGMPEARITIGQLVCYLACAPKSNASYVAIDRALADVRTGRVLAVPMEIRDPNSSPAAALDGAGDGAGVRTKDNAAGAGRRYEYSHSQEDVITGQDYLGVERRYYEPGEAGAEAGMREVVDRVRGRRRERRGGA